MNDTSYVPPATGKAQEGMNPPNSVAASNDSIAPRENEPKDGALYQQRMKAWYPILHPVWVIAGLLILGIVFIPVGFRLIAISDSVVELSQMYDSGTGDVSEDCAITEPNANQICNLKFTADKDMESPIMIYYQIDNFYQNHRKYFMSRDDSQLLGKLTQTALNSKNCEPLNKLKKNGTTITLNPCGLIANTLFNDIITLVNGTGTDGKPLAMLENGIAWESDLEFKFHQPEGFVSKECDCDACACLEQDSTCNNSTLYTGTDGVCWRYYYPNDDTTQYLHETYPKVISPLKGVTDEHFIVWMRSAALPKFRKLYGYIDKPITKGTELTFQIDANWIVDRFNGSKTLVLTTTSMFGGKNPALGRYFIGVGIFCLISALFFGVKHAIWPRKLADPRYLKYKED